MLANIHSIPKVLFIVHLAIGDYTYMQRCFDKLKKTYPSLRIDLFVMDNRFTDDPSKWESLNNYVLYEWLESSQLFGKIYKTFSPEALKKSISDAKLQAYPLVISLGDIRSQNYSDIAKDIADKNIALGIDIQTYPFHFSQRKKLKLLDGKIKDLSDKSCHISEKFAHWFSQIDHLHFHKDDLYPSISIPEQWQDMVDLQLSEWKTNNSYSDFVFINIYAKQQERCWGKEQAIELIKKLQYSEKFHNSLFILNCPPDNVSMMKSLIDANTLSHTVLFYAKKSFYELPALLKRCNLIITVDTSIMHLACVSDAKLISLCIARSRNNRRWLPLKKENSIVLHTPKRAQKIEQINVDTVLRAAIS